MQAGAVDLVHLSGRSVLEPFQLAVCKGEWSYCSCGNVRCSRLWSVKVSWGLLSHPVGPVAFPCTLGISAHGQFPFPLWLFHGSFGSCCCSPSPRLRGHLAPTGDILVVSPGGGHCHLTRREWECCSAGDAQSSPTVKTRSVQSQQRKVETM